MYLSYENMYIIHLSIIVDKAKVEVIEKMPPPTFVKLAHSFLEHVSFLSAFHQSFFKNLKSSTNLLIKDVPFNLNQDLLDALHWLNEELIPNPTIHTLDWNQHF